MDAVKLALVFAVEFALVLQHADCMCQSRHPQEQFCKADYVILAGIKDSQTINEGQVTMETHYTVNTKRVFKSTEAYQNATKTVIISPAAGNLAVPTLQIGTNYLITDIFRTRTCPSILYYLRGMRSVMVRNILIATGKGNGVVVSDKLYTSYCDWVEPYKKLTNTQRNGLRKKYEGGCECQFTICNEENCGNQDSNTCAWDIGSAQDCIRDYAICKSTNNGCNWIQTELLNNCTIKAFEFRDWLATDEEFPAIY